MEGKPTPWYKRRKSTRARIIESAVWVPGFLLVVLAEDLTLKWIGLVLIVAGFSIGFVSVLRSRDT